MKLDKVLPAVAALLFEFSKLNILIYLKYIAYNYYNN